MESAPPDSTTDTGSASAGAASLTDLALVIPVRDDAEGLEALLAQARRLEIFDQIVVVDDGSTIPVVVHDARAPVVDVFRQSPSRGGGVARNRGLAAVRTSHVLFFDADDLLTDDIVPLVADLRQAAPFDFCLFKHVDSRIAAAGLWGQPGWDEVFWRDAGCATSALMQADPAMLAQLVQTANYPWNKIYRTAFLRDNDIGCAETSVHQDIPLHWLGFLVAENVLVSARICAFHKVSRAGTRITNRRGIERLEVFDALAPVRAALEQADTTWRVPFLSFVLGLIDWIADRIEPVHLGALRQAERSFFEAGPMRWREQIAVTNPGLARRMEARCQATGLQTRVAQ